MEKGGQAPVQEVENCIPGMILADPSVFDLLTSTMQRMFYCEEADKRNCAIAGFEYHGTLFRINVSRNGAWLHTETVQEEKFSEAAARRVHRNFDRVRVESEEPTAWGIYSMVVDGNLRCIRLQKITQREFVPSSRNWFRRILQIYRDWVG
jgi:hypothetical protein